MLGHTYRFNVNNQAGVTVDVTVKQRPWKIGTNGALVYGSETTVYSKTALASGATWTPDTAVDNSTNLYIGADLIITVTPSASATGYVTIQLEKSTDGGTVWPTGGNGEPAGYAYFSASAVALTLNSNV